MNEIKRRKIAHHLLDALSLDLHHVLYHNNIYTSKDHIWIGSLDVLNDEWRFHKEKSRMRFTSWMKFTCRKFVNRFHDILNMKKISWCFGSWMKFTSCFKSWMKNKWWLKSWMRFVWCFKSWLYFTRMRFLDVLNLFSKKIVGIRSVFTFLSLVFVIVFYLSIDFFIWCVSANLFTGF